MQRTTHARRSKPRGIASVALLVALMLLALTGSSQAKKAKADDEATSPQLTYTYLLTRNLQLDAWIVQLKNSRYVENVLDILDAQYKLPRTLEVRVKGCDKVNAMYSHKKGRITLCAELLTHFESIFRKALTTDHPICSSKKGCDDLNERVREWTLATTTFVLWHEMGHAFVQELKLPASGREEDVADQVAVYVANMGDPNDATPPSSAPSKEQRIGFKILTRRMKPKRHWTLPDITLSAP